MDSETDRCLGEELRLVHAAPKDGLEVRSTLDVFEAEPTPPERWRSVPNLILTPHIAGRTREALSRIVRQLLGNLEGFFSGGELLTGVRPAIDGGQRLRVVGSRTVG